MSQQLADAPRRLRLVLIAVCIALMAVIASVSGLNVAQPDLAVAFGASQSAILWIINVYTLGLAALLLPLGALGDRLGRKPALLAGLLVFGVANVVAGLAPSTEVMFAARLLSGLGAAMIMPVMLAVITATFPAEQRGKAIGVWTGVAGGGGILGMSVSALLVDVAGWRWLFVLPVVLVAVALVMAVRYVPNSREREGRSYDVVGAVTSAVAVVGLILVLQEGPARGWGDPLTLAALVAGLLAACCFVAWELRRGEVALLDVRLFRSRGLASGSVTLLAVFGVQAGIFVVLFPFFQAVLGVAGARLDARHDAHGPADDGQFGTRAEARGTGRGARDDGRGHRARRGGARAHGGHGLGRRRLPVAAARDARDGRGNGALHDPVDRGDHRRAAPRTPGRGLRAQRRDPRIRYGARRGAARRAALGGLPPRARGPSRRRTARHGRDRARGTGERSRGGAGSGRSGGRARRRGAERVRVGLATRDVGGRRGDGGAVRVRGGAGTGARGGGGGGGRWTR
ncbi:integral membrane transporter [Streptomyces sp. SPB78]|nr:integral membrane transporter [Streptomyces sp. SPB78]